jgi:hypothetical protein
MIFPGETEAGSAGTQPCRGIAWWAHRCLENPRPEGRNTHQRRAPSLHFRLNQHRSAALSLLQRAFPEEEHQSTDTGL